MNFDLIAPCPKCPFRTDVRPYLRTDRVAEICESITDNDSSFPCHKTTTFDDEGDCIPTGKEQQCAGAMIMLEQMNMPNQVMRIGERIGIYDRTRMRMDSPVYKNSAAMIAAYRRENKRTK
jgi:hypothetical protein